MNEVRRYFVQSETVRGEPRIHYVQDGKKGGRCQISRVFLSPLRAEKWLEKFLAGKVRDVEG